jgi:hypothetical protein
VTVTLSRPLQTEAWIDVPEPADHPMTMLPDIDTDSDTGSGSLRFAKDDVGVDHHNDGHRHIDALCRLRSTAALLHAIAVSTAHRPIRRR